MKKLLILLAMLVLAVWAWLRFVDHFHWWLYPKIVVYQSGPYQTDGRRFNVMVFEDTERWWLEVTMTLNPGEKPPRYDEVSLTLLDENGDNMGAVPRTRETDYQLRKTLWRIWARGSYTAPKYPRRYFAKVLMRFPGGDAEIPLTRRPGLPR